METSRRFTRFRPTLVAARPERAAEIEDAYLGFTTSPPVDPEEPDFRLEIVCDLIVVDMLIDFRFGAINRSLDDQARDYIRQAANLYLRRATGLWATGDQTSTKPAEWMDLYNKTAIYQGSIDPGVTYGALETVRQAMTDEEFSVHNVAAALFTTWDASRPPAAHPMIRDWLVTRVIGHLNSGEING